MHRKNNPKQGYIAAFLMGVVGGGHFVALATRALPKMMSQMMAGMMQTMMSQAGEGGCNPPDI